MAWQPRAGKTRPWDITLPARLAGDLRAIARTRGMTLNQLLMLVGNGVTRGLVPLDLIEEALVKEGWWEKKRDPL